MPKITGKGSYISILKMEHKNTYTDTHRYIKSGSEISPQLDFFWL
jgi:hypothetical protein